MQEVFGLKVTPYSLRDNNILRLPKANTSRYGTEAPCFKGSIIGGTLSQIDIKIWINLNNKLKSTLDVYFEI